MALSDKWSLLQLRTLTRAELADPASRWFPDSELNQYLDEWQLRLQDWFEFVWGSATASVTAVGTVTSTVNGPSNGLIIPASTASILLSTFIPDALRCDAFYWVSSTQTDTQTNGVRLAGRVKQDLDILIRDWRYVLPADPPLVIYQDDINDIVLWPPPANAGTVFAEYPIKTTTFGGTDTATMQIPAWTKYSASHYCAYRCYLRTGPRQDIQKAMTYKAAWMRYIYRYRRMWDNYLPDRYTQLKPKQPSDQYNIAILNPPYITVIPP